MSNKSHSKTDSTLEIRSFTFSTYPWKAIWIAKRQVHFVASIALVMNL